MGKDCGPFPVLLSILSKSLEGGGLLGQNATIFCSPACQIARPVQKSLIAVYENI
jgi:hypothetical protein